MELVVVNERGQVNELVDNYDCAKHEAVATREAFDNEHELRIQLEARVTQQEQDICKALDGIFHIIRLFT